MTLPKTRIIRRREPTLSNTQAKVDHDGQDQAESKGRRAPFLVVYALDIAALADLVHAPDIEHEAVEEGQGG